MHARIYDFTLTSGGMQRLPVVGDFFKVISATGTINVNVDTGATLDLMPGQGLREFNFNTLTITDKSGAANVGKILVGFSGMIDDRVTGEVSVIDGGIARTKAKQAFLGYLGVAPVAGMYSYGQLWNPAGSGKNLVLGAVSIASPTAHPVFLGSDVTEHANGTSGAIAKLVGSGIGAAVVRYQNPASSGLSAVFWAGYLQANSHLEKKMLEPVVIQPGKGVSVVAGAVNTQLLCSFEFYEEPV